MTILIIIKIRRKENVWKAQWRYSGCQNVILKECFSLFTVYNNFEELLIEYNSKYDAKFSLSPTMFCEWCCTWFVFLLCLYSVPVFTFIVSATLPDWTNKRKAYVFTDITRFFAVDSWPNKVNALQWRRKSSDSRWTVDICVCVCVCVTVNVDHPHLSSR